MNLGRRKAPRVQGWSMIIGVYLYLTGRVVNFQGRFAEFFGKFSLEVVPAGLTSGFRVKFAAGPDKCTTS